MKIHKKFKDLKVGDKVWDIETYSGEIVIEECTVVQIGLGECFKECPMDIYWEGKNCSCSRSLDPDECESSVISNASTFNPFASEFLELSKDWLNFVEDEDETSDSNANRSI